MKRLIEQFKKIKSGFFTYHVRPRFVSGLNTWSDTLKNEPKTAIIIQGPLLLKDHFTLETIKIYKKIFKEAIIIVSTWENEDQAEIEIIRKEKVEIILNKKPEYSGRQNINLQIVSSVAGVKRAKDLKAEYVLKTRCDQRMYAPNSLDYLRNILHVFPVKGDPTIQKKRIVGVSLNTFKYRPYGLSDMTIFGITDDMVLYWDAPLDNRVFEPRDEQKNFYITGDFARSRICEIYLVTEFLKKLGRNVDMTIADSWQVFSQYLCVVDKESLNIYWNKYDHHREYKDLQYENIKNNQIITFSEWLNMYNNLQNKSAIPEHVLKTPFGSVINEI